MSNHDDPLWQELRDLRHDLHRHPEFGFEETRTGAIVAGYLRSLGLDATEGIGGTGVVATIRRGGSNRAIMLRADMDALKITEAGEAERTHRSLTPGLMHACGHDGHTVMLLGAARRLVEEGGFDGTVHVLFQPAEEWGQGMNAMLADGLLERFPTDEAYGIHNAPGLPVGHFETRPGPFKSAEDNFAIRIARRNGDTRTNVIVAASAVVLALQDIVAGRIAPGEIAIVSCTELLTHEAPAWATILGDCRWFRPHVSTEIQAAMREIAAATAASYGFDAQVDYSTEFVATINDGELTAAAVDVAKRCFGPAAVNGSAPHSTGSEDFARLLERVPGCYANIGNGPSAPLHNPAYDFNDEAMPHGVRYFVELARSRLPLNPRP